MNTDARPTTERDLSDLTSANCFLDQMAQLILAHHSSLPPTIHRETDGPSMLVDWTDNFGPRCAHVVVQCENGDFGSVWLFDTPDVSRTDGCVEEHRNLTSMISEN